MAARRRQTREYREDRPRNAMYIDGSAVQQEVYQEEYEYIEEEYREERQDTDYWVRRNQDKARHWTLPYVLMLLAATTATVVICFQFLQLRSSITLHQKNISKLESQLASAKTANDVVEENIELYTDLDYIYDVAVNELGMVYPSDDQVIEYDKSESEYVRQYDEIPTED